MTFKPLTREDVFDGQTEVCYDYYVELKDVRSAFDWLKEQMLIRYYQFEEMPDSIIKESHMREIDSINELVDMAFPVFSQSLSEDAKINDGCSQQVTSAPSSEAKSSVSHHVSMGAATESVANSQLPQGTKTGSAVSLESVGGSEQTSTYSDEQLMQSIKSHYEMHLTKLIGWLVKNHKDVAIEYQNSLSQPSEPSRMESLSVRKTAEGTKQHGVPAGEFNTESTSVGEVDVKHAARKGCTCKHGSGAITKQFVEENKLCNCECHKKE